MLIVALFCAPLSIIHSGKSSKITRISSFFILSTFEIYNIFFNICFFLWMCFRSMWDFCIRCVCVWSVFVLLISIYSCLHVVSSFLAAQFPFHACYKYLYFVYKTTLLVLIFFSLVYNICSCGCLFLIYSSIFPKLNKSFVWSMFCMRTTLAFYMYRVGCGLFALQQKWWLFRVSLCREVWGFQTTQSLVGCFIYVCVCIGEVYVVCDLLRRIVSRFCMFYVQTLQTTTQRSSNACPDDGVQAVMFTCDGRKVFLRVRSHRCHRPSCRRKLLCRIWTRRRRTTLYLAVSSALCHRHRRH